MIESVSEGVNREQVMPHAEQHEWWLWDTPGNLRGFHEVSRGKKVGGALRSDGPCVYSKFLFWLLFFCLRM